MLGLSKILYRKFNYLISESSTTLETLKHPFGDLNEEAPGPGGKSSAKRPQKKRDARDQNFAHGARPKNMIDLSVVKYPGINHEVMEKL